MVDSKMVCPKLKKGKCRITKAICKKSYKVKMQAFKTCSIFKRGAKARLVKKKAKKK
jgi:hypothetical protein